MGYIVEYSKLVQKLCKDRQPHLFIVSHGQPLPVGVFFKNRFLDLMMQWHTVGSLHLLAFITQLVSDDRIDDIHQGELSGL